jgi:hypothetical protein
MLTSVGAGRAPWRKNRGGLEDLVGAPQLLDLAVERLQPLALAAREQVGSPALVGFGLADPAAQRLALDAEVLGDLGDRAVRFKREADASLSQLVGVLLRCWHSRRFSSREDGSSSLRGLREVRPAARGRHEDEEKEIDMT